MSRRGWTIIAAVAVPLLAGVVAVGVWAWTHVSDFRPRLGPPGTPAEWAAAIDELRARDEPVELADVAGEPPPAEDDGAPLLREAWAWADANLPPRDEWPWPEAEGVAAEDEWGNAVPSRPDEIRAFAARLGPYLELVDAALARRRLWLPPPDEPLAGDDVVPRLQLTQRALWIAGRADDDPDARLVAVHRLFELSSRIEHHHTIRSMVAYAIAMGAAIELRRRLAAGEVDAAETRRRLDHHLTVEWLPRLRDVIRFERTGFIWTHQVFLGEVEATLPVDFGDIEGLKNSPAARGWYYGSGTRGVRGMQSILDLPLDSHVQHRRDFERASRAWRDEAIAATTFVVFPDLHVRFTRADAVNRLARIALALAEHRRTHGSWPGSLDALAPLFADGVVPIDPWSDRPFVYQRLDDRVRVSSPGPAADPVWGETYDESQLREYGLVWELRD